MTAKLLPREPSMEVTQAMYEADQDYSDNRFRGLGHLSRAEFVYRALFDAAPSAPTGEMVKRLPDEVIEGWLESAAECAAHQPDEDREAAYCHGLRQAFSGYFAALLADQSTLPGLIDDLVLWTDQVARQPRERAAPGIAAAARAFHTRLTQRIAALSGAQTSAGSPLPANVEPVPSIGSAEQSGDPGPAEDFGSDDVGGLRGARRRLALSAPLTAPVPSAPRAAPDSTPETDYIEREHHGETDAELVERSLLIHARSLERRLRESAAIVARLSGKACLICGLPNDSTCPQRDDAMSPCTFDPSPIQAARAFLDDSIKARAEAERLRAEKLTAADLDRLVAARVEVETATLRAELAQAREDLIPPVPRAVVIQKLVEERDVLRAELALSQQRLGGALESLRVIGNAYWTDGEPLDQRITDLQNMAKSALDARSAQKEGDRG